MRPICLGIVLVTSFLTLSPAIFAQHGPNDGPKWDYEENYSDKIKLHLLTRKAHYEQKRAEDFTKRGVKGYKPTSESLNIAMPATATAGNRRLKQLNRISTQADKATRAWIDYEFDVIRKRTFWLIHNGKL